MFNQIVDTRDDLPDAGNKGVTAHIVDEGVEVYDDGTNWVDKPTPLGYNAIRNRLAYNLLTYVPPEDVDSDDVEVITSSGDWDKPDNDDDDIYGFQIELWGGGAGGGANNGGNIQDAGRGGNYVRIYLLYDDTPDEFTVTIGAGGSASSNSTSRQGGDTDITATDTDDNDVIYAEGIGGRRYGAPYLDVVPDDGYNVDTDVVTKWWFEHGSLNWHDYRLFAGGMGTTRGEIGALSRFGGDGATKGNSDTTRTSAQSPGGGGLGNRAGGAGQVTITTLRD